MCLAFCALGQQLGTGFVLLCRFVQSHQMEKTSFITCLSLFNHQLCTSYIDDIKDICNANVTHKTKTIRVSYWIISQYSISFSFYFNLRLKISLHYVFSTLFSFNKYILISENCVAYNFH